MHLPHPRIPPVALDALTPAQADALARASLPGRAPLNIFRTFAHAPEALAAFLPWGSYVLSKQNSLNARQREIVVAHASAGSAAPAMNGREPRPDRPTRGFERR